MRSMIRVGAARDGGSRARLRFDWIYGPAADLFIALCWVPVFLVAHTLTAEHGAADHSLNRLFNATFLFSLLHQPLTLALVYGDKRRFAQRRALFIWSPVVAISLVSV